MEVLFLFLKNERSMEIRWLATSLDVGTKKKKAIFLKCSILVYENMC